MKSTGNTVVNILVPARETLSLANIDALVIEQDTHLLLGVDEVIRYPRGSFSDLVRAAEDAKAIQPGTVLPRGNDPIRLLAVVHDLDQDPSWQPEWVELALATVFLFAAGRKIRRLAMPVLGAVHGQMSVEAFAKLLAENLQKTGTEYPQRLILLAPPDADTEFIAKIYTATG